MKQIWRYIILPITLPVALLIVLAAAMVSRFSIEKEHFDKPFLGTHSMNWLEMISRLFNWLLRKRSVPVSPPVTPSIVPPVVPPVTPPPSPLFLTHPEEPEDPTATLANVNTRMVMEAWLIDWNVSLEYWAFWRAVDYWLVEDLHILWDGMMRKVPAATYASLNRMDIDPRWANPGILAHEAVHISQSLMTDEQKQAFVAAYAKLMNEGNALLAFLFSQKPYGKDNVTEAQADMYRFLGGRMPEELKEFYPKLI